MKKILLLCTSVCMLGLVNAQDLSTTTPKSAFKNYETAKKQQAALASTPSEAHLWFWEKGAYWSLKKRDQFTYTSANKVKTLIVKDSIGNFISRENMTYEKDTLLTENLVESWFNNDWVNTYRLKIWYNNDAEPIKEIVQSWENNDWVTYFGFSTHKTFDPLLNLETTLDSMYNGNSFELVQKIERYYNLNKQVDSEILHMPLSGSTLEPYYKQAFYYTNNGLMDSVVQYIWDNGWKNDRSTTRFLYDTLNRVYSVMNNVWDGTQWTVYTNTLTNYLPYNSIETADYIKPGVSFIEYKRQLILNDSLYNQIKIKYDSWDGVKWVTDMHESTSYKYLPGGIIQEKLVQIEDEFGQMQNETKQVYFFNSTGTNFIKHTNLNVYPNPSKDVLNISGLNADENAKITIVDLQGKVLLTKNAIGQTAMDISTLKPGVYVLRVGATVKKIVVSR